MRLSELRLGVLRSQTGSVHVGRQACKALILAALIVFVCSRQSSMLLFSAPEFALLDVWFRLRPPRPASTDIALIGVDGKQLEDFQKRKNRLGTMGQLGVGSNADSRCTCATITRDTLAETIVLAKRAGARLVALDMVFELPCPVHDPALLKALALPGDTVLVSGTNPTPGRFNFTEMPAFLSLATQPIVASPVLYNPNGVIRGVRMIQEDPPQLVSDAPGDITVMRVRPPLAVACYLAHRGQPEELPEAASDYEVRCGDVNIPVLPSEQVFLLAPFMSRHEAPESKHAMLISWAGRMGTFPMYSMRAVKRATPDKRADWLKGKIVIIGSSADRQYAPMRDTAFPDRPPLIDQSRELSMAGLEIHANALDTILQRRFIRPVTPQLMWLIMLAATTFTLVAFRKLAAWKASAIFVLEIGVLFFAAYQLMCRDVWLYAFIPSISVLMAAIAGAVWGFTEIRHTAEEMAHTIEARDNVTLALMHDSKQPLAAISALAQVLSMQVATGKPPTPELIERIQQQVQMALGDIDELLTTDPNREIPLALKHFDVAALARDLATAQSLKSSLHTVEVQAPPEGLWISADPRYLGRALSNLMDNAIKYWPEGGTVVVEIRREPGQAKIRVIDHGLGIAPEAQHRLFNRFQRAVPAGIDIPGTGIGLFSVKRIIEAHGGHITLISAPGEGSIFALSLPLPKHPPEEPSRGEQE